MRSQSLLIIGRSYTQPTRFPQCDVTWTTTQAYKEDSNISLIPNLLVWGCHSADTDSRVDYDIREHKRKWAETISKTGRQYSNQICYMLAAVGHTDSLIASVTLFGCIFMDEPWLHELPYVAYHIGYLKALGIPTTICQPSNVLIPKLYGGMET